MSDTRYVYAIRAGDLVKVGWTGDPDTRFKALQTGQGHKIEPIAIWPDTQAPKVEKLMHSILHPYRRTGEWFECPDNTIIEAWEDANELRPDSHQWAAWAETASSHGLPPIHPQGHNWKTDRPNPIDLLGLKIGTNITHVGYWAGIDRWVFDSAERELAEDVAAGLYGVVPGGCACGLHQWVDAAELYIYYWSFFDEGEYGDKSGLATVCAGCAADGTWPVKGQLALHARQAIAARRADEQHQEKVGRFYDWVMDYDRSPLRYLALALRMSAEGSFGQELRCFGIEHGHLTERQITAFRTFWYHQIKEWWTEAGLRNDYCTVEVATWIRSRIDLGDFDDIDSAASQYDNHLRELLYPRSQESTDDDVF